jgi:hypothetical protein
MPKLRGTQLDLKRSPHCNVDTPTLWFVGQFETKDLSGSNIRKWRSYVCARCGGLVTAAARDWEEDVIEMYPSGTDVDSTIPDRARTFLDQAKNSLSSPSGAVMLAASAVDAMLKAKGLKDGSLYSRIDKAAADHLITVEMARWAHEVRLDANDQRHADEEVPLPQQADAKRAVDFALALAQLMFVLPARVQRGIEDTTKK